MFKISLQTNFLKDLNKDIDQFCQTEMKLFAKHIFHLFRRVDDLSSSVDSGYEHHHSFCSDYK